MLSFTTQPVGLTHAAALISCLVSGPLQPDGYKNMRHPAFSLKTPPADNVTPIPLRQLTRILRETGGQALSRARLPGVWRS